MKFLLGCDLAYDVAEPTLFVMSVEVAKIDGHADLRESLKIVPQVERRTYTRPETQNRIMSFVAPAGPLSVRYEASVDLHVIRADPAEIAELPVADVPLEIMPYLLPSRFSPADRLAAFAAREFGALQPGHQRVTAICNWICQEIDYRRGASDAESTAVDTLVGRAGVCRDFSHLGIAFCRALGIPARFVSCYALGLEPGDFHAVFEAYLGGKWWLFDPTRQAALDGLVRIGIGRDAADASFATTFGTMRQTGMQIWIRPAEGEIAPAERTVEAIRVE
jgi:transglutaminase-like putative cysteine protease